MSAYEERNSFSGVSCLCQNDKGEQIGHSYPKDNWVSEWTILMQLRGEKWGFHRTELLRELPFPQFEGEKFCPEGVVWGRLHDKYLTLCINEPLRIYFQSSDSITNSMIKVRYKSILGTELYYREQVQRIHGLTAFRHAANYVRFTLGRCGLRDILNFGLRHPLVILVSPLGVVLYLLDKATGLCQP